MIKLVDILLNEDLPKGKWVDLDNKKTKEYTIYLNIHQKPL